MTPPPYTFFCRECGPSEAPCKHFLDHEIIRLLKEEMRFNRGALLEILHDIKTLLNRPQSATLRLQPDQPFLLGEKQMPATILVGGTASSLFQEYTGPNGTGTIVPNAGAPAFTSSNTAVATVDPASGVVTGVSAGQATITGDDPANNLSASDTITVNAPSVTAVSATLTLTAN
jgi:hypothetical protein